MVVDHVIGELGRVVDYVIREWGEQAIEAVDDY